jgi:YD repeat-containing protein
VTVKREDGKLEFYYFENGKLVSSKTNDPKW